MDKKWSKEELETHIKANFDYGSAPIVAALFKKIYGEFPKIGMSGHQGSAAEMILDVLPEIDKG